MGEGGGRLPPPRFDMACASTARATALTRICMGGHAKGSREAGRSESGRATSSHGLLVLTLVVNLRKDERVFSRGRSWAIWMIDSSPRMNGICSASLAVGRLAGSV